MRQSTATCCRGRRVLSRNCVSSREGWCVGISVIWGGSSCLFWRRRRRRCFRSWPAARTKASLRSDRRGSTGTTSMCRKGSSRFCFKFTREPSWPRFFAAASAAVQSRPTNRCGTFTTAWLVLWRQGSTGTDSNCLTLEALFLRKKSGLLMHGLITKGKRRRKNGKLNWVDNPRASSTQSFQTVFTMIPASCVRVTIKS